RIADFAWFLPQLDSQSTPLSPLRCHHLQFSVLCHPGVCTSSGLGAREYPTRRGPFRRSSRSSRIHLAQTVGFCHSTRGPGRSLDSAYSCTDLSFARRPRLLYFLSCGALA